jgi:hypothetical protein
MILEYAQLLSTAHRVLGGTLLTGISDSGRKTTSWILPDADNDILYKATHINHPSAIWVRQSDLNYMWLYVMFRALLSEYTYRYGKQHACERLIPSLENLPRNFIVGKFTEPTPAMPPEYIVAGDSVQSYKNYYNGSKKHLHNWKLRPIPDFIEVSQC